MTERRSLSRMSTPAPSAGRDLRADACAGELGDGAQARADVEPAEEHAIAIVRGDAGREDSRAFAGELAVVAGGADIVIRAASDQLRAAFSATRRARTSRGTSAYAKPKRRSRTAVSCEIGRRR